MVLYGIILHARRYYSSIALCRVGVVSHSALSKGHISSNCQMLCVFIPTPFAMRYRLFAVIEMVADLYALLLVLRVIPFRRLAFSFMLW